MTKNLGLALDCRMAGFKILYLWIIACSLYVTFEAIIARMLRNGTYGIGARAGVARVDTAVSPLAYTTMAE